MACLRKLKDDIQELKMIFTRTHERFRVMHSSVDEMTFAFVGPNDKAITIHANFMVCSVLITSLSYMR